MTVSITSESLLHLRDEGNYYIGVRLLEQEFVGRSPTIHILCFNRRYAVLPPHPPSSCTPHPQCVSVSLSLDLWTIGGEVE